MSRISLAKWMIVLGLILCLWAILYPRALIIFVYLSLGHSLIVGGFGLYAFAVWKDLKKHGIL